MSMRAFRARKKMERGIEPTYKEKKAFAREVEDLELEHRRMKGSMHEMEEELKREIREMREETRKHDECMRETKYDLEREIGEMRKEMREREEVTGQVARLFAKVLREAADGLNKLFPAPQDSLPPWNHHRNDRRY